MEDGVAPAPGDERHAGDETVDAALTDDGRGDLVIAAAHGVEERELASAVRPDLVQDLIPQVVDHQVHPGSGEQLGERRPAT